jgi:hypothetical protein
MDLETEARNDCAGEDQQQFNRPTYSEARRAVGTEFSSAPELAAERRTG